MVAIAILDVGNIPNNHSINTSWLINDGKKIEVDWRIGVRVIAHKRTASSGDGKKLLNIPEYLNRGYNYDIVKQEASQPDSSAIYQLAFWPQKIYQVSSNIAQNHSLWPLGSHIWSLFDQSHMQN